MNFWITGLMKIKIFNHCTVPVIMNWIFPWLIFSVCVFLVETLVGQLLVPALRFVLFLYVQHIQKISLRASLVSGSDEYPLCLCNKHNLGSLIFLKFFAVEFHIAAQMTICCWVGIQSDFRNMGCTCQIWWSDVNNGETYSMNNDKCIRQIVETKSIFGNQKRER